MKLRYYMRGLGIGIIVTALIMGIAAGDGGRPLTDAEIREAALKLGMVESDSLKLTDIQPVSREPEESRESGNVQEEEESRESGEAQETEELRENEDVPEEESREEGESQENEDVPEEESREDGESQTDESNQETGETVTITVQSGSGSRTVCNQLAEAGLIENAAEFDRYLIDNGYSKRICVGTYEIEVGVNEEEIAKIITKTR